MSEIYGFCKDVIKDIRGSNDQSKENKRKNQKTEEEIVSFDQESKHEIKEREEIEKRIKIANEEEKKVYEEIQALRKSTRNDFEATIKMSEESNKMGNNLIMGLAAATANLYNDLGYVTGPPEEDRNPRGRIFALEAASNDAKVEIAQSQDRPKCFKCDTETKSIYCGHSFCPKCHVKEGKVHCPVCKAVYE